MKRTAFFAACAIAVAALFASCGDEKSTVKVKCLPSETNMIYFGYCSTDGDKLTPQDTVAVKDGIAILDVNRFADKGAIAYFFLTPYSDQVYFLPQKGTMVFEEKANEEGNLKAGTTFELSVKNISEDNKKLQELYAISNKHNGKLKAITADYQVAMANNDTAAIIRINEEYAAIGETVKNDFKKFIPENTGNIAGQVALVNSIKNYKFDIDAFDAAIANLPEGEIKNKLIEKIEPARKIQRGNQFLDVTLPTPDGDTLKLSEIVAKNKVTLLDFWASWCGPCRQFNPVLVEIYKEFHSKGFDIYAISLDEDQEQWTNAIKEQELTWNHVSNLKAWDCPARMEYLVEGIPANFLIDADGKIIDHDLTGDQLKEKLTKLLAQ